LRRHALRLKLALAPHRMKEWPFAGRVGIREAGANGMVQLHVLDGWRHLGTLDEGDELPARSRTQPFDLDVYRILVRHLRDPHLAVIELPADLDTA